MDITRAQQKDLDDDLVALANRLKIGKYNLQLSSNLNSEEPTLQVVLNALKLTSFYKAFEITPDIFPKLPGQKFEDHPFEEEILSFIRDLGHTSEIKVLSDVNVNHMHQPLRSFAAIINKCLSGKTTALENLVYQVENKNSKKNNDMYYPRFTNVIIYGVILPKHLTNQAMLESEAYKTYHDYATGKKIPKPKYVKNKADPESSPKKKYAQASKGKRIKTSTKIKLATKRSLIQTHSSHASGSGADEGTDDDEVSMSKDDDDNVDDDHNDDNANKEGDDDQDDDNEQTESDNDDDDFGEEIDEEETNEEEEANELYRDVNVNLEKRDTEMTDALLANVQTTQV
ncbi:hypothetical protein Tco_0467984 [Tanacetum coccineum]